MDQFLIFVYKNPPIGLSFAETEQPILSQKIGNQSENFRMRYP